MSSGYDDLTNPQKDYVYVNKLLSQEQLQKYLTETTSQKMTAKQDLKDKRHINETDVTDMTIMKSWCPTMDALEKVTFEVVDPISANPHIIFDAEKEEAVKARWFWNTRRFNLGEAKTYWAAYAAYWNSTTELLQAKADLEDHSPIDPSIADLSAPDSNWRPDKAPDPESAGLIHDADTGKSGSITIDNIWDANNPDSVKARMFWNSRRFTHEQAFHYAAIFKEPSIIERNRKIAEEWNKLPIYKQDQIHSENFPDDKYGIKRFEWQKALDAARLKAISEINAGKMPNKQEYEAIRWSPVNDINYLKFGLYTDKANPHSPNYDPHYDPNNPAYNPENNEGFAEKYKDKTVVEMLSESKKPYTVVEGRIFWDTGRYTAEQADRYLKNKGYIEPYKAAPCVIDPWKETLADLPRYLLDYLACSFSDFKDKIDELFGYVETGVLIVAIGLLIAAGYVAYNNRKQLKLAAITSGSYASNLIPGKQYYELKKQKAAAEGTSVSYQIGQDAREAYNPVGLIGKVSNEYAEQNPNSFTAGLLK